jgi:hypothetical protein
MQILNKLRSFSVAFCACAALLAGAPASAQHAGGWHGGGGGWHGGWHGGFGWRGGFYGPWGWGLGGLGLGLYFATLPYYYSTYWWGGIPYYYADNNYYIWNSGVGQYQTVAPPAEVLSQAGGQAGGQAAAPSELIAYPKNGQSEDQLGKDKFECHRWAVSQTGFDPTQAGGGSAPGKRSDYSRAQAACLEGRGYSVK